MESNPLWYVDFPNCVKWICILPTFLLDMLVVVAVNVQNTAKHKYLWEQKLMNKILKKILDVFIHVLMFPARGTYHSFTSCIH